LGSRDSCVSRHGLLDLTVIIRKKKSNTSTQHERKAADASSRFNSQKNVQAEEFIFETAFNIGWNFANSTVILCFQSQ
jgi:hypothetical protein